MRQRKRVNDPTRTKLSSVDSDTDAVTESDSDLSVPLKLMGDNPI